MLMSLLTKKTAQFTFMLDRQPFRTIAIMNLASSAVLSSLEILVRAKFKVVKIKMYRSLRMRRTRDLILKVIFGTYFSIKKFIAPSHGDEYLLQC